MTYPLTIIVAMDRNRLIGSNNQLPWHIPADLNFFKATTLYNNVVMGKSTFESIGKSLPKRTNIILTSQKEYPIPPDGYVYDHIDDVLVHSIIDDLRSTYIIGGSSIYLQFLPYADNMIITHIDAEFEGDTYFPEYNISEWECIHERLIPKGQDTDYNLTIKRYKRFNK
ncbi:dihydrofolate reductase [Paenibacillus tianjinensis]|uniref:Dihydrofolate reductase n=1 Tax=Paenibacillus tianjinensis TaxID=2810347 RepID=A0ABX7L6K5_9BACL|nr:dihydrofolate reductase [Paenibacillus tianjinensis]QSF43371.1 dihydrofolate reductase [Paenibacillus tianjinensis]